MREKRGQEEIVGFVLVVALVLIIGLVFLGIGGQKKGNEIESREVAHFAESVMHSTSDCSLARRTKSLHEVLVECHASPSKACDSGENVCEAFNKSMQQIMDASWNSGGYSGYVLSASYRQSAGKEEKEFFHLEEGICGGNKISGEALIREGRGTVTTSVTLCSS